MILQSEVLCVTRVFCGINRKKCDTYSALYTGFVAPERKPTFFLSRKEIKSDEKWHHPIKIKHMTVQSGGPSFNHENTA